MTDAARRQSQAAIHACGVAVHMESVQAPKTPKKGEGNVFFSSTRRKGQLTWRQRIGQYLVDLRIRHVAMSVLVYRESPVGVGGRESGCFVGGDGGGRGVMMFGRAELVGRVPPCQKYFPGGPCRACGWVDAGLPGRYLGNKGNGRIEGKKKMRELGDENTDTGK